MLRKLEPYMIHEDSRGRIEGIINAGTWAEINMVVSEPGSVRGQHYHKGRQNFFTYYTEKLK